MYLLFFLIILLIILILFSENKENFTIGGQNYPDCGKPTLHYNVPVGCQDRFNNRSANDDCTDYYYVNNKGNNIQCVTNNEERTYNYYDTRLDQSRWAPRCKDGEYIDSVDNRFCKDTDNYLTTCSIFPYYTYYTGIKYNPGYTPVLNSETGCESKSLTNLDDCDQYYEYNDGLNSFYKCKKDSSNNKCISDTDLNCKENFLNGLHIDNIVNTCSVGLILALTVDFLKSTFIENIHFDDTQNLMELYNSAWMTQDWQPFPQVPGGYASSEFSTDSTVLTPQEVDDSLRAIQNNFYNDPLTIRYFEDMDNLLNDEDFQNNIDYMEGDIVNAYRRRR